MSVSFLKRDHAPDLAYQAQGGENTALPTIVFLTGFCSDMEGTKASFLSYICEAAKQNYIRFDYSGHGVSGGKFEDGCIGVWLQDTLDIVDRLTTGPLVLVGSSMGGWIGLLATIARPERVAGYIGLAAAPDFTRDIISKATSEMRLQLSNTGSFPLPNDYSPNAYHITQRLIDEGERHILLDGPIAITCPVRLVQGMKDIEVPWQMAHRIMNAVTGTDKEVYLREEGDHRLSFPDDLALLQKLVTELSGYHEGDGA